MKKTTFIAWVAYHRRTELLAQHLGSTLHFVSCGQQGQLLQAPLRYLIQTYRTWCILRQERPDIILVQNPPIVCALVAWFYCRIHGGQYIIDSHTGALVSGRWGWTWRLHRTLSRRALITFVHNASQEKIVARWGCPHMLVAYTPGDCSVYEPISLGKRFNVVVISSYHDDEPIEAIFQAARLCSGIDFFFTGNPNHLDARVLAQMPDNCHLTGYLPYSRYVGVLRGADAIMTLTDRDHTLLMGGFEALCIGKPLITSNWPVLQDYFKLGTIHVRNSAEDIAGGVRTVQANQASLEQDMIKLRNIRDEEWRRRLAEIRHLLGNGSLTG